MNYSHAFFDLDGTLTDSAPGITHSVQYALRKLGITPPPAEELTVFVGPPLTQSFSKYFGLNEVESRVAVDFYRQYYRAGGMLECKLYDGIRDLLEALRRADVTCVLATCKPHEFARRILAHFEIDSYFSFVSGPEMDGTRGEKHEVIAYAMQQLGLQEPSRILMIGDRDSDVLGARANGIRGVGVLWGFGSEKELREVHADAICASPAELQRLILGTR